MKKTLSLILSVCFLLSFALTLASCNVERDNTKNNNDHLLSGEEDDDNSEELKEKLEYISMPDGSIGIKAISVDIFGKIVIPTTYEGKTVTAILDNAFENQTNLVTVEIPSTVTTIGRSAFLKCTSLDTIIIPFVGATLDGTENTHFSYIFGGETYSDNYTYVPKSLKHVIVTGGSRIDNSAFSLCSGIETITLPDSLISIGDEAFSSCSGLTTITLPDSLISMGDALFYRCIGLKSLNIPNSVTSIGNSAFSSCIALRTVTIPESVTSVGNLIFFECYSLVEIINKSQTDNSNFNSYAMEVHSGDTKIVNQNGYMFYSYEQINYLIGYEGSDTDLILPQSYNGENYRIYNYAFYECKNLKSIVISDSVTDIAANAFNECSGLTSITISLIPPNGIEFNNCSSLMTVYTNETVHKVEILYFSADFKLPSGCIVHCQDGIFEWL